ncbi:MAG TPA: hypothetical protein EYG64_02870 [Candidatus Nitrosopelagicus sp.]|jgi:hypothetical protein|nr:hypothetical protein [Candidatus Nitrosopelagicus sp.]
MFGKRMKGLKEGDFVFAKQSDGKYNNIIYGAVTGVDGNKIGVNGVIINPVGLKNKIEQGKAGKRSIEILKNPNPDNCILLLIYRIEYDNFNGVLDLDKQQVLELPNRVYATLDGWIRESLSELINNVLSLPPGSERDQAKIVLKQRMDTLFDKQLKRTLYAICRSLKILN